MHWGSFIVGFLVGGVIVGSVFVALIYRFMHELDQSMSRAFGW